MNVVEFLLVLVASIIVVFSIDGFFGSPIKHKGRRLWRKFADWIRDVVTAS